MAILYIAAEAQELKPLARRLTGLRALKWPIDYAQEGILDGRRVLLAANGAGPKLAADALEIAIRAISAADLQSSALELAVSVGLCGALQPGIRDGQIIVASHVKNGAGEEVIEACPVECDLPHTTGVVLSLDRIAGTSKAKAELGHQFEAIAIEMESFGVAQRAKRAGLPFCCIKAVGDRVDESFGFDFNELRTSQGRISRGKIVSKALTKPILIPELLRLKRRADRAAELLGEFLVSCRFSLQSVHAG